MISYVIPTRNRPQRLKQTLLALDGLGHAPGEAEVVVVDNASECPPLLPASMPGGLPVTLLRLRENMGAAGRNEGARAARGDWIVMLDDDSHPDDAGLIGAIRGAGSGVGAIAAEIRLERRIGGRAVRESGGLPEVFIGCGAAVRRDVFLSLGGYDPSFGYYAEEYDLSAKMLRAGLSVAFDRRFRVTHAKVPGQRDMGLIVSRLTRNNGWVMQRYAPEGERWAQVRDTCRRYRAIGEAEGAVGGYARGVAELRRTIRGQARSPMTRDVWERFTGLAAAREALQAQFGETPFRSAGLVDEGKNAWVVREALRELGVRVTAYGEDPEALVVGTMSPGPMLDAYEARLRARRNRGPRVLAPWREALRTARTDAPARAAA